MAEPWADEVAAIALVRSVASRAEAKSLTKAEWIEAAARLEALSGDSEPLSEYADDAWLEEYYGDE